MNDKNLLKMITRYIAGNCKIDIEKKKANDEEIKNYINSLPFKIVVYNKDNQSLKNLSAFDSIDNIDPENSENKIQKVCELFVKIAKEGFINKTDNSVIYISTRQDSYAIPKDSILYCKSDLKYTVFVTDNGMLIRKLEKLQDVENKYLWDFMRVHQSFLINPQKVKSIDKTTNEIILSIRLFCIDLYISSAW